MGMTTPPKPPPEPPSGVYVVKDDQVRWVPALNMTFIAIAALGVVRVLARSSSKRHRRHH
jgi:hypothetical protein